MLQEWYKSRGLVACKKCGGEGIIKAKTEMLSMTAGCGRCNGTGEEPKALAPEAH